MKEQSSLITFNVDGLRYFGVINKRCTFQTLLDDVTNFVRSCWCLNVLHQNSIQERKSCFEKAFRSTEREAVPIKYQHREPIARVVKNNRSKKNKKNNFSIRLEDE